MFRAIKFELYKLFTSKKLYIIIIIVGALNALAAAGIYMVNHMDEIDETLLINGQSFPAYTLGQFATQFFPILLIILLAGIIADEYRDGTLKLTLLKPIKRGEVLVSKIFIIILSIVLLLGASLVSSYLVGTMVFGWGEEFIVPNSLQTLTTTKGFVRTIIAYGYTLFPFLAFGLGILIVSILINNSGMVLGASIGFFFLLQVVTGLSQDISPFVINHYFALGNVFLSPSPYPQWIKTALVLMTYTILPLIIAFQTFQKKDIVL